jgi:hypothetical protein
MKTYQECTAEVVEFNVEVPSSSDPGKKYQVSGLIGEKGSVTCSCPAFYYNGTCKHINKTVRKCGWSDADSGETQTLHQRDGHICPRCGGRTVNFGRGAF